MRAADLAVEYRNAGSRPPAQRVRDYINGTKAATAWALGTQASQPVQVILTSARPGQPPNCFPPESQE